MGYLIIPTAVFGAALVYFAMKAKLTRSSDEGVLVVLRDEVIWDTDIRGFGLKVTPKGCRINFVKSRVGGCGQGRQRKPSMGAHGILTCEQARQIARKCLAEARDGNDPLETQQMPSKAETVAGLITIAAVFKPH